LQRGLVIALTLWPLWAGSAPLTPGSPLPPLTLEDQHGRTVAVEATTQWLIFTVDKATSDFVNGVLAAQGPRVLDRLKAVYVADISAMPGIVTRMFALPKLRELPFSIALAREAAAVADLPRRAGAATVLTLDNGQVIQVQYLQTEAQLRQALALTH
jgi:hypothetical protein